jgi:sortase A
VRRLTFWIALAMVAAGVAILGFFVWQYVGTNIVSHHRQHQQIDALQRAWAADDKAGDKAVDPESGEVPTGDASALVRIPRFGKSYVMPVIEGTSDDVLAEGIGHFEDTAQPGQQGNYALAAHRITHGEPFAQLPDLRPGDTVTVETRTAVYTYVLDTDPNDLVVPNSDDWVLDPFPVNPDGGVQPDPADGDHLITLTTCSELFHTDNRMIAFGHLETVATK